VSWTCHREVLTGSRQLAALDRLRAFRPSVLEEADGTLRMWYSGHDGSTGRILEAAQQPGQPWERVGISIDAGSSGESDAYGVEAPSVVRTPVGFLMAYAGSDGAEIRLHMASSDDGHRWEAQGTFMRRVRSPSAMQLHDGRLRLWYATHTVGEVADSCHLWSADLAGAGY